MINDSNVNMEKRNRNLAFSWFALFNFDKPEDSLCQGSQTVIEKIKYKGFHHVTSILENLY